MIAAPAPMADSAKRRVALTMGCKSFEIAAAIKMTEIVIPLSLTDCGRLNKKQISTPIPMATT